jgi:hypothetical protein
VIVVDSLAKNEQDWEKTLFYATKLTGYTRQILVKMYFPRFFDVLKEAKLLAEKQNK